MTSTHTRPENWEPESNALREISERIPYMPAWGICLSLGLIPFPFLWLQVCPLHLYQNCFQSSNHFASGAQGIWLLKSFYPSRPDSSLAPVAPFWVPASTDAAAVAADMWSRSCYAVHNICSLSKWLNTPGMLTYFAAFPASANFQQLTTSTEPAG